MFDLLWPQALLIDFTHSFILTKKKHPKWSLITQYISPLALLLHFSSVNPCIFPVLDYWCPLHHVPFCFSDEITLYSSHFWSVYACSYSAAIQMDSFDWSMYVNEDKSNSAAVDLTNNALLNCKPYAERQEQTDFIQMHAWTLFRVFYWN